MRCSRRSAPLRSTLQVTPGYLASNALPICSDSFRSTEVYQTTLPSFLAASISAGVTALAGGAADSTRVENEAPATSALEPISKSRRENFDFFIGVSSMNIILLFRLVSWTLSLQRPAFIRRQHQPDRAALRDALARGGDDPQLRAVLELDHIVPAAAEKDLSRHGRRQGVFRLLRLRGGNTDVVRADRDRAVDAGRELGADAAQRGAGKADAGLVARFALDHVAGADEACNELRARSLVDIFRRSRLLDLAVVHHADQIGGGHRL